MIDTVVFAVVVVVVRISLLFYSNWRRFDSNWRRFGLGRMAI